MESATKNVRIDTYDFFGYLAPGALLTVVLCLTVILVFDKDRSLICLCYETFDVKNVKTFHYVVFSIFWVLVAYIVGHIVATFSSLFLEKVLIGKIVGHPYCRFVVEEDRSAHSKRSKVHYKVLISSLYMIPFLYISQWSFLYNKQEVSLWECSVFIVVLWFLVKWVDDLFHHKRYRYRRSIHLFFKYYCVVFSLPMIALEVVFSNFMGMKYPLPDEVKDKIQSKFKKIFGLEPRKKLGAELWWSIYWYVVNSNDMVRARVEKFVTLYGLMRNMSFSCLISSICFGMIADSSSYHPDFFHGLAMVFLFCSVLFVLRYYYLYNNYYAKTVYRFFAYVCESDALERSRVKRKKDPRTPLLL